VHKTVSMVWTLLFLTGFAVRGDETSPRTPDLPEDPAYYMRLAVRKAGVVLNGPTEDAQAEGTDFIKGHDIDAAGNVYWAESNSPVIRSYRAETGRVITLAGSVRGLRDGPLESARFGGWWYKATNLLCVSEDGKHLFVVDRGAGNLWRYVDLEAGVVRTIGSLHDKESRTTLCIVKDRRGGIRALTGETDGAGVLLATPPKAYLDP